MPYTDPDDLERSDLQTRTSTTTQSMHDLKQKFYKAALNITTLGMDDDELERAWLQKQTGSNVQSLYDLWQLYLKNEGITPRASLYDMFYDWYAGTNAFGNGGQLIGLPFGMTYA